MLLRHCPRVIILSLRHLLDLPRGATLAAAAAAAAAAVAAFERTVLVLLSLAPAVASAGANAAACAPLSTSLPGLDALGERRWAAPGGTASEGPPSAGGGVCCGEEEAESVERVKLALRVRRERGDGAG